MSRTQRRHYSSASRCLQPGKASKYINPLDIRPGGKFVICCRVSTRQQGKRQNLTDQAALLRLTVAERGGVVMGPTSTRVAAATLTGCDRLPCWPSRTVPRCWPKAQTGLSATQGTTAIIGKRHELRTTSLKNCGFTHLDVL